jgi:hypothetical protein
MALQDSRCERVLDAREVYEGIQKGEITLYDFERWVELNTDLAPEDDD